MRLRAAFVIALAGCGADLTRLHAFELEMSALERSGSVVATDFELAIQ